MGSITGRAKPKAIKINVYSFPAWLTFIIIRDRRTVWSLLRVRLTGGPVAAWLEDWKISSLFAGKGNYVHKNAITIIQIVSNKTLTNPLIPNIAFFGAHSGFSVF